MCAIRTPKTFLIIGPIVLADASTSPYLCATHRIKNSQILKEVTEPFCNRYNRRLRISYFFSSSIFITLNVTSDWDHLGILVLTLWSVHVQMDYAATAISVPLVQQPRLDAAGIHFEQNLPFEQSVSTVAMSGDKTFTTSEVFKLLQRLIMPVLPWAGCFFDDISASLKHMQVNSYCDSDSKQRDYKSVHRNFRALLQKRAQQATLYIRF